MCRYTAHAGDTIHHMLPHDEHDTGKRILVLISPNLNIISTIIHIIHIIHTSRKPGLRPIFVCDLYTPWGKTWPKITIKRIQHQKSS